MDFTLALTHFCEIHGPKSILCTQVLPLDCLRCIPSSPSLKNKDSFESYTTQVHDDHVSPTKPPVKRLQRTTTDLNAPGSSLKSSSKSAPPAESPSIEQHPLFKRDDTSQDLAAQFPYGRAQGETCASCSFTVPQAVTAKLPRGAPGSLKADGKNKNGAPVLRSREFVCLGERRKRHSSVEPGSSQDSRPSSLGSFDSTASHSDCHDHTLTYLTAKSPEDPENYSQLRAAVVRALCCEQLPKGMSEGPLCFGDSVTGYTIAYVFRLTDPQARGRRRAYAFVALAGTDACRAFKACPMLWDAFATMSKTIEQAAQRFQDERAQQERRDSQSSTAAGLQVSAFLTQRSVDPDGHPRRPGQTQPRSLAEIVGDENIFAILHQYFVAVLRCLGDRFGGVPLADQESVYQTFANEREGISDDKFPSQVQQDMIKALRIDDESAIDDDDDDNASTPPRALTKPQAKLTDTTATTPAPKPMTKHIKRDSQCAPYKVDKSTSRQVAV